MNGDGCSNLLQQAIIKKWSQFDQDVIRLIGQYLSERGLDKVKNELISQSGFTLETSEATKLRSALLGGDWPCATSSLDIIAKREKLCEGKLKKIKYWVVL